MAGLFPGGVRVVHPPPLVVVLTHPVVRVVSVAECSRGVSNGSLRSPCTPPLSLREETHAPLGKVQDEGVRFGGLVAVDEVKEVDGRGRVGLGEGQWEWGRSCGKKLGWIWWWFLWLLGLAAFCLGCWEGEGCDDGEEEEEEEEEWAGGGHFGKKKWGGRPAASTPRLGVRKGRPRRSRTSSPLSVDPTGSCLSFSLVATFGNIASSSVLSSQSGDHPLVAPSSRRNEFSRHFWS